MNGYDNAKVRAVIVPIAQKYGVERILLFGSMARGDADESSDDDEPQWRNGLDGYGLYRGEVRIDGGSADDE